MSDYSVAVDKKSKRKKKKRSERSRSLDKKATESELPEDMTATTSPAIPKVENQESIKNRYLSISAPSPKGSPGVLAPAAAQNKADSSPVHKPSSKKTAPLPMKHEDVVVKMMQKRLAKTESDAKKSGKEMTAKIEALEKEVAKQKATAEEQDKVRLKSGHQA